MPAATIPLDQFELIKTIGEGGTGVVWKGRHTAEDVTVAVKVLTNKRAEDAKVRAAFRNEVRQAASLHHGNIITLFDQGEVSTEAAQASYGELTAGSPYLAMEYLRGGTLMGLRGPVDWELLRGLLFDILDALAHAHARGVIHRDLKPANVLLHRTGDVRHGLKLTDFGIAHAMDTNLDATEYGASISGTLRYMAPEQILGQWRDEGPWTDLYALGVLAYRLSSGVFPFGDTEGEQLVHGHLNVAPPRIVGRMPLPVDFDQWVGHLLAKRPINRFACAADAAFVLDQLGPAVDTGGVPVADDAALPRDTSTVDATPANPITGITETSGGVQALLHRWDPSDEAIDQPNARPPMPETWRRAAVRDLSIELVGAGLGLYGLRPVPMVARTDERDVLWENLRHVNRRHATRLVALYGSAGCGKSRIVQWISQRAEEVGAARLAHATHGPLSGQADGLRPMFANLLRCAGLPRAEVAARCHRFVIEQPLADDGDHEGLTIAELIAPAPEGENDAPRVRLATAADRYRAGRRLIQRLCSRRPLVLWFDDVQWGSDALGFAEFLLTSDHAHPMPILIALTVRTEAAAERPWERAQLDALLERPESTLVDVSRLSPTDHTQLVTRMLGLASGLVDEVASRTDGNPLFAVQLIGDWVERGLLQTAHDGFSLRPGVRPELPDDLHQLWTKRVDHVTERFDSGCDDAVAALQLGAALGKEVLYAEWYEACDIANIDVPDQLLEQLWTFQLAGASDQGWSFTHGMLRESLERRAREHKSWGRFHRACAQMLENQYGAHETGIAARRGRHLVAAGDLEAALELLLKGAEARREASEFHLAYALFQERRTAMLSLDLPDDDRRWADNDVRWARARVTQGHLIEATQLANAAEERAEQYDWTDLKAWAHSVHGAVALARGDINACYEEYARGAVLFRKLGDRHGLAECLVGLGGVCYWTRDLPEAQKAYEEAYELIEDGNLYERGIILRGLGNVRHLAGDADESTRLLERSLACFDHNGNRFNAASCMNDLGEIKRARDELDEAEALYQKAGRLYESLGCADASTPNFNLGLLRVQRKKYAAARDQFQTELVKMARAERTLDLLWVHAGMVPCMAADNDWDGYDYHLQKVYDLVEDFVDADIAYLTELAGRLATEARQAVRGQQAYRLALSQYKRIEDADKVAALIALVDVS